MSMEKTLKEILDEILDEVEQELEEATTTAGVDGYQTPFAFGAGRKKDKKKEKDVATQAGYTIAESVNEDKFYNTRVQYTDPKSKKKFVGDVVRKDGDEYKVNLGKDGRFEKYILAKAKDLKIVSKSKKRTYESVNEGISVFDERHFGKKGIIIMIDDNGKKVSAIFKDKKNADKFNRNNPSDIKKLLQLAKKTKFPKAIDESVNEGKAFVVMYKVKKDLPNRNVKPSSAAYSKEADAKKFLKSIEKDGGKGMIVKSNVRGMKEGKKRFKRQDGIGKAKYTISYHDGKKKHKDGSDFFDIKIFKNKKDLSDFVGTLVKQGYKATNESINEAKYKVGDTITVIRKDGKKYKGKVEKLNPLKLRTDSTSTVVLPNPTIKKVVKESINEAKQKRPVNRWLELKNDESMHPHKKMAMGLKELKYQLKEVEKFFNWYNKIKTMNELDSQNYWKRTNNHIYTIKEKLIKIAKTIQEIEK